MRRIVHPGSATAERIYATAGSPVPLRFDLEPGRAVDEAIAKGFAASGCIGGYVMLQGGCCEPFRYVIPAASPDTRHAAWYSETFEPAGPVTIIRAGAIVGVRDGKPFIHCHGIWDTADGRRMGHLLTPITTVVASIAVTGIGLKGATFQAVPDPETNFTLFEPIQVAQGQAEPVRAPVLLAKVRPNEDISLAVEELCSRHGIARARIHGIGSLNEVRFTNGAHVPSHATEVLIREGRVESAGGGLQARLLVDAVDMAGAIASGELVRGDNPVCVTFELLIEPVLD